MAISYKKLWKLFSDRDMKKTNLVKVADISSSAFAKLDKDKNVSSDMFNRICIAPECNIGDVMKIVWLL